MYVTEPIAPITRQSDENAFLSYVKAILYEVSGISVEGWSYRITTTNDGTRIGDCFIGNGNAKTVYTFTFYKAIDGIERFDTMEVSMTAYGEIIKLDAINSEEVNVKLDRTAIERAAVDTLCDAVSFCNYTIDRTMLVPHGDALLAHVLIEYSVEYGAKGGLSFVIKVAEIRDETVK